MPDATIVVLTGGLAAATVIDLRSRRIPNSLTGGMIVLGVGFAAFGASGISMPASLLGLILGFLLMMPGYALGATGAGDVKLMAAVGAIIGPGLTVTAFLFTAIAGGVLAVVVAVRRRQLGATFAGTGRLIAAPTDARRQIRSAAPVRRFAYGPAIAIGSVLATLVG